MDENDKTPFGDFEVKCKNCGSTNIELENSITLVMKNGKLDTIQASGKMADLIARGMASDLGLKKVDAADTEEADK